MLSQIQQFEGNALALELAGTFTVADAMQVKELFDEKIAQGYPHINILVLVKDLSILNHMEFKAFLKGEMWGIKYLGKIGRCAVVAQSRVLQSIVNFEGKVLHLFNAALDERYFDLSELDSALQFISTGIEN
jgi:hypothetical protein